jgi:hypothetical protein
MAGWPSSSVPESILWLIRSIGSRGSLDGDEVARYAPRRFRERGQRLSASLIVWRTAFGVFIPVDCAVDQGRYVIQGRDARNRSCTLSITVEQAPPFRFERYMLVRDPPPGYSYREARLPSIPSVRLSKRIVVPRARKGHMQYREAPRSQPTCGFKANRAFASSNTMTK